VLTHPYIILFLFLKNDINRKKKLHQNIEDKVCDEKYCNGAINACNQNSIL
jgi:hypothetical protein